MEQLKGKTALVTGASSGIGEAFAGQLAAAGANLVLVARREDRLKDLASQLESRHGVKVNVIKKDLGEPDAAEDLYNQVKALGCNIDMLVNNAGIGTQGNFLDDPLTTHHKTISVNVIALHDLTWLFAKDMVQRGSGNIVLIASLAGFMPIPRFSVYAATKAFVLNLGGSLAKELEPLGVGVTTVCPGGTSTEFFEHSGQEFDKFRAMAMMSSESVAKAGLKAALQGKTVVVPGMLYKLSVFGLRLVPRRLQAVFGQMATD